MLQEAYASLTTKTLVFLQLITSQFDAEYIFKVDDDVYLRTDRLPHAMAQWTKHGAGAICVLIQSCHLCSSLRRTTACRSHIIKVMSCSHSPLHTQIIMLLLQSPFTKKLRERKHVQITLDA